jgi:hypothetical protein
MLIAWDAHSTDRIYRNIQRNLYFTFSLGSQKYILFTLSVLLLQVKHSDDGHIAVCRVMASFSQVGWLNVPDENPTFFLKMEAVYLRPTYQTAWCCNREDDDDNYYSCERLKCYVYILVSSRNFRQY